MAILADVAPYSREYNTYRQRVGKQAQGNTELEIEYEKILNRVKKTRESVIRMQDRHFTAPVDEISGTVDEVSPGGITLKEYPGRSSSSHRCRPVPPICRRGSWANTRSPRPGEHKNPRAGAIDEPLLDSGVASSPVFRSDHGGQDRMVSSSCRTQKPSRTRQTETIHDLGRSLFLASSSSLYMESRS